MYDTVFDVCVGKCIHVYTDVHVYTCMYCLCTGQEGIAAGKFLPKLLCLVHGKVTSVNLDLRVRTGSSLLTDSLVKLLEQVFK